MKAYCWKGCPRGVVLICLILAGGCASPVRRTAPYGDPNKASVASALPVAEISNGSNQMEELSGAPAKSLFFESARNDFADLPNNILEDSKDTFLRSDNITALLLAGGATIAMNQGPDKDIEGYFDKHEVSHGFADRSLKFVGSPVFHFGAAGLWYALSADNQDEFNKNRAWIMVRALCVTGLATVSLKAIRDDETPAGNRWAWPSGHTSSSFAAASVLDEFYGPEVGIPAYVLATLVGIRMADQADHWASDVVFGATLGWVVGHTVAGKGKKLEIAGFTVLPYTASNSGAVIGVNLFKRF